MKKASAFMEYAIILGIVSLVLVTMNIYIKRGFRGKVKEMSDFFINKDNVTQVAKVDPNVDTVSESEVSSETLSREETFEGGGKRLAYLDTTPTAITFDSTTMDTGRSTYKPDINTFVPADFGDFNDPDYEDAQDQANQEYDPKEAENESNIKVLESIRDGLLLKAVELEKAAAILKTKGQELVRRASRMSCHGSSSCRRARRNLANKGNQMISEANAKLKEAAKLRQQAAQVQARIDSLLRAG